MKKLLLLAGAACMALVSQGQEQMYFNGFEDAGAQFTDSTHLDSLMKVEYYDIGEAQSSTYSIEDFQKWGIGYVKDTTIYLISSIEPYVTDGREDHWEMGYDPTGEHQMELEKLGTPGGNYYLKYISGGEDGDDDCPNYKAKITIRNIPIEEHSSYRVTYYVKTKEMSKVDIEILRGYSHSNKAFSLTADDDSPTFTQVNTDFPDNEWTRVTFMSYYTTDSIAETYMYTNGFSWRDYWTTTNPEDGKIYNSIKQHDTYYLRFSFLTPANTYCIDDITVFKSWIGGAEYNGNVIRIDFGYETNLADLVKATGKSAMALSHEYFKIDAFDTYIGERADIPVQAAEYHDDGYLYIFLEEACEGYDDVRIKFTNPSDEKLQLKYTGETYPKGDDQEWIDAGKIVPDFENEFVLYSPLVSAIQWADVAPTLLYTVPDDGSFTLDPAKDRVISAYFDKEVYTCPGDEQSSGVVARITGSGVDAYLTTGEGMADGDNYRVDFSIPESITNLKGDYEIQFLNARPSEDGAIAEESTITLSYGPVDLTPPTYYLSTDFDAAGNDVIPEGWLVDGGGFSTPTGDGVSSSNCRILHFGESDMIYACFYIGTRGSKYVTATYGEVSGKALHMPAGDILIDFYYTGWESISSFYVQLYKLGDADNKIYNEKFTPSASHYRYGKDEYTPVNDADHFRKVIALEEEGDYVLCLTQPTGTGTWEGFAIGDVKISNNYSSATGSITSFNKAYEEAVAVKDEALASIGIYGGPDYDAFVNILNEYSTFTSTSPKAYAAAVETLNNAKNDMKSRMNLVDEYYVSKSAADKLDSTYAAQAEKDLAAYVNLHNVCTTYAALDVTTKNFDELTDIKAEFDDATAALELRIEIIADFKADVQDMENIFAEHANYAFVDEYKAVQKAYNAYAALDVITALDKEITDASAEITDAVEDFNEFLASTLAATDQLQRLSVLAGNVQATFGEYTAADIDQRLSTTLVDDQDLAGIYMAANTAKIYADLVSGTDSALDLTGYIRNSILYTVSAEKEIEAGSEESFPGWEILEVTGTAKAAEVNDGKATDTYLNLSNNSGIQMKQTLKGLPAGNYTFSYKFGSTSGTAKPDRSTGAFYFMQYNAVGDIVANDTLVFFEGSNISSGSTRKISKEFTALGSDVDVLIDIACTTYKPLVDDFRLSFDSKAEGADYESLKTQADQALEAVLNGVVSAKAVDSTTWYNLSGIQIAKPAKGINIRVRLSSDGQRTIEKVYVK